MPTSRLACSKKYAKKYYDKVLKFKEVIVLKTENQMKN